MLCGLVLRDLEKSVAGPDVDGLGPRIATKWIWKSQCNERERGEGRAGAGGGMGSGSAKDVFGVGVRSLAFWKMDRVTLLRGADAFYSPEPLVDFLHEVNFPVGSFSGFHFCCSHFCLEILIFLKFDEQAHSRKVLHVPDRTMYFNLNSSLHL